MAHSPYHRNRQPPPEPPIISPELQEQAEEAAKAPEAPAQQPFKGNVQPERWDPPAEHGDYAP